MNCWIARYLYCTSSLRLAADPGLHPMQQQGVDSGDGHLPLGRGAEGRGNERRLGEGCSRNCGAVCSGGLSMSLRVQEPNEWCPWGRLQYVRRARVVCDVSKMRHRFGIFPLKMRPKASMFRARLACVLEHGGVIGGAW